MIAGLAIGLMGVAMIFVTGWWWACMNTIDMDNKYRMKANYSTGKASGLYDYDVYLNGQVVYTGNHTACKEYINERASSLQKHNTHATPVHPTTPD